MLADASLPYGSDASLSAVGSLSQKLSHRQIALAACSGRILLVEQQVLSQFVLLRQPVKRLSRRTQVPGLEALHPFVLLGLGTREPKLVHQAQLSASVSVRLDLEGHYPLDDESFGRTLAHARSVYPMGFL